ncbi:MAG: hypothetical protein L0Y58_10120 [Verrucomicrobia subdivision 3 bacterium]|nr:hypothetical protein [Limisphaerales bacterium]
MSRPDVIRRHQDWLVRRIVRHAWERVPYYARLMRAVGVRPQDIGGAADSQHHRVSLMDSPWAL